MSFDLPSPPEWDAILSASQKNNAKEVRRLIERDGVPATHANIVGQTALHIASLWGSVEALRVLLEHGADPNAPNRIAGMTPLHCAVRGTFQSFRESLPKRLTCIRLLLEAGADPTLEDLKGKDALKCVEDVMKEAQMRGLGNIESEAKEMRAVLEGGVTKSMLLQCVDERDVDGVRGRLSDASRGEWSKGLVSAVNAIQTLMDERGDEKSFASVVKIIHILLEAESNFDNTPAHDDTQSTKNQCLETVISFASSATPTTFQDTLPFLTEIAQEFLSHNAQVNNETQMLLPSYAHRGKLEMIQFLINVLGIDPNFRGRQGMTALHFAARGGKSEIVRWMLDNCPTLDANVLDGTGQKAVDYARANGKENIVELLSTLETRQG
ncbi:hypothetical protein ACHAW6_011856 [Cyclotella cf. meneghiniana]